MKELTITKENVGDKEINAVDARSLWVVLGARKQFGNWIQNKVLNNPFFEENVDWEVFNRSVKNPQGGRPAKDYILSLDTAKKVAMAEQTEKGNEVRNYFIECEKRLQKNYLPDFTKPAEAARAWAFQYEEREKLRVENERNKPKVEYYDSVADASGYSSMGEVAKILGTGRNRLFARLRKERILMKNNDPYQKFIDAGYFVVKQRAWGFENTYTKPTTYVTGKGTIWLQKRFTSNKLLEFKPY